MTWKIDNIDFKSYGVYVSKSSGVLDLPEIIDTSNDWLNLNGREYWQDQVDVKYQDREIVLQCWILSSSYSDFKTKVRSFLDALIDVGSIPILSTPFGSDIAFSLLNQVQVVRKSQYNQTLQAGRFTLRLTVLGDAQTKLITIYNSDDSILAYGSYGSDARLTRSLQGNNEITLTLEFATIQTLGRGNYVIYDSERYISLEYPQIDKISTNKFVYRITYVNRYFLLKDIQFRSELQSDFYWWANVEDVVDKVIENANRGYSGLFMKGIMPDVTPEYRNHQFQNENCYDVLAKIASDYELEFEYVWNSLQSKIQINVREQIGNSTGITIEYGKGNGGHKVSRVSTGRELLVTRLYAYGSDKNIPASYGFSRLKLDTEPVTGDFYGMHIEKTKVWDDIFPHRTGIVTSYTFTPDGVNVENSKYDLYDSSMFDLNAAASGSSIYLNGATKAKVHFNSGQLAGFEFEVNDFTFGAVTGGTFHLTPVREVPNILYPHAANDPVGTAQMEPAAGDEYVILDINLPQSYIDAAEVELQAKANAYINDYKNPKPTYTIETDPSFSFGTLRPGDTVTLVDSDFGIPSGLLVRITDIMTNLYQGGSTITVSSYVSKSKLKTYYEKVDNIQKIITNTKLNEVNTIKGDEMTVLALKNAVINPLDEKINPTKIRQKIITFTSTDTPQITGYNAAYGDTIGEYPMAELYQIDDSGNRVRRSELPYFILDAGGLISTVSFGTLPEAITGFILLQ